MPVSRRLAESLEQAGFPQQTAYWWVYRGEWQVVAGNDLSYNELALAAPDEMEILRYLPMKAEIKVFDAEALGEVYLENL